MNFDGGDHILLQLGILESTEPSPKRTNYENVKTSPRKAKPSAGGEREKFVDVNIDGDVISDNEEEDIGLDENELLGSSSRGSRGLRRIRESESYICRLILLILTYFSLGASYFAICTPPLLRGDAMCHFVFCLGAFCGVCVGMFLIRKLYWVFISLLGFALLTLTVWSLHTFKHLSYISFLFNGASYGIIAYCGLAVWFSIWKRYSRYILSLSFVFSLGFFIPQILFSSFDRQIELSSSLTNNDGLVVSYPIEQRQRDVRETNITSFIAPDISDYLIGSPAATFSIVFCIVTILSKLIGFLLCCLRLQLSLDMRMEKLFDTSLPRLSPESRLRFLCFQCLTGSAEGLFLFIVSSKGTNELMIFAGLASLGKFIAAILGTTSYSIVSIWSYLIVSWITSIVLLVFTVTPFTVIIMSIPISLLGLCCTLNIEKRISPRPSVLINHYLSANLFGQLISAMFATYFEEIGRIVILFFASSALVIVFLMLNRGIAKTQRLKEILEYSTEPLAETLGEYVALTESLSDIEVDDLDLNI
ncbi:unnamed protein product [Auanema sp. JU1783]|nr:unnamed protein product [Auanema sp. JU1783]